MHQKLIADRMVRADNHAVNGSNRLLKFGHV